MKVVIHRYNSICEPDYIEAFESLGIEVIQDSAEITDKAIPLEAKVKTLSELILTQKPLFVFSINFFPYISMICEKLGCIYVCVSVDCPVPELYSVHIRNKCNRIFLFDYQQYLDIHDENPDCIFHMPLGAAVERINATIGEPNLSDVTYKYDISFVGSLYNEKNPYRDFYNKLTPRERGLCDGLLDAQELIPGQQLLEKTISDEIVTAFKRADRSFYPSDLSFCNLDRFVTVNDYLSPELSVRDRHRLLALLSQVGETHLFTRSDTTFLKELSDGRVQVHGGVKSLTEMPLVFRQSRININHTIRSIQLGLPQRIWDVLGCGGFLLTNYQEELPEYFEIGTHLEAYETMDEAMEKAEYYLAHEEERRQIAECGYELVATKNTVRQRVVAMIAAIVGE